MELITGEVVPCSHRPSFPGCCDTIKTSQNADNLYITPAQLDKGYTFQSFPPLLPLWYRWIYRCGRQLCTLRGQGFADGDRVVTAEPKNDIHSPGLAKIILCSRSYSGQFLGQCLSGLVILIQKGWRSSRRELHQRIPSGKAKTGPPNPWPVLNLEE